MFETLEGEPFQKKNSSFESLEELGSTMEPGSQGPRVPRWVGGCLVGWLGGTWELPWGPQEKNKK